MDAFGRKHMLPDRFDQWHQRCRAGTDPSTGNIGCLKSQSAISSAIQSKGGTDEVA
jgi:hypothetical protein